MHHNIDDLLQREIAANQSLDLLIDQILNGDMSEESLARLMEFRNDHSDEDKTSIAALEYSRAMRSALSEEEFRWLQLDDSHAVAKNRRRDRAAMYHRLKKSFDVEIALSRKQKRSCMALARDWSTLDAYVRESLTIARCRFFLNLAGLLFRAGIPGASDLCDAAVFGIFRVVYLSAA